LRRGDRRQAVAWTGSGDVSRGADARGGRHRVTLRPQGPNWPATEKPDRDGDVPRDHRGGARASSNALVTTLMLPGFTDSHYFRRMASRATAWGHSRSRRGSPAACTGNDERVRIDALRFGVRFYYDVVTRVAAK